MKFQGGTAGEEHEVITARFKQCFHGDHRVGAVFTFGAEPPKESNIIVFDDFVTTGPEAVPSQSASSTKSLGSAKNDKRISKFHLVLDHKATNKMLKLWAVITQVIERTYLADNHSKILLVRSEKGDTVSVITS